MNQVFNKRQFSFITIHPTVVVAYRQFGVFKAAESLGSMNISAVNLRDFACDKHATVDGSPYGGGDGMIMRPDCLDQALNHARSKIHSGAKSRVIYTSPSGKPWTQKLAKDLATSDESLIFICGRFGGVDQRFIDSKVDDEFSVGDFVLAGGELPSLMILESVLRYIPGVLGHESSVHDDSLGDGLHGLLEAPSYTRPIEWNGLKVPEVLTSGDHEAIKKWRQEQSRLKTSKLRPDLIG